MKNILILCLTLLYGVCFAELDPYTDYRFQGVVERSEFGDTSRSSKVISSFKKLYPCPSTGKRSGSCPGWAIDHVIPLACGGRDAVYNMQWLPNSIKSASGHDKKDHFERKIYGGRNMSKGCP